MRIVSGSFKGRRLASFRGMDIRPTSDKVREAIFNILPREFPFRKVLDIFAGTGAMGLEAMSRGAVDAVFVDSGAEAVALIKKNMEACGAEARVFKSDAIASLKKFSRNSERFDLIIIDPPYATALLKDALEAIDSGGLLSPGGVIVAESSSKAALGADFRGLEVTDERRYGDTAVYFLRRKESGQDG